MAWPSRSFLVSEGVLRTVLNQSAPPSRDAICRRGRWRDMMPGPQTGAEFLTRAHVRRCGPEARWCKHEFVCTPFRHCKPNPCNVRGNHPLILHLMAEIRQFHLVSRAFVADLPWGMGLRDSRIPEHAGRDLASRRFAAVAIGGGSTAARQINSLSAPVKIRKSPIVTMS